MRTKRWTRESGREVRMFGRDDVELALEEGMSRRETGELVGASRESVRRWAAGRA